MSYEKHSDNEPKVIRTLTFISSQLVLYLGIFKLGTLPQNQYNLYCKSVYRIYRFQVWVDLFS